MKTFEIIPYINNISFEEVEYLNCPIYYGKIEYNKSIQKIIEYLSNFKEILAIYQIGGISSPGISDIDLIVVFDNSTKSFQHSYRKLFNLQDAYLFMHSIYGIKASVFEMKDLLIPIHHYTILYGKNHHWSNYLSDHERMAVKKIYALEYVVVNLFNLIAQYYIKQLKVRNILCSLHALKYDFHILSDGKLNEDQKSFCEQVDSLRKLWFSNKVDNKKEFFNLSKKTVELIYKMLSELSVNSIFNHVLIKDSSYIRVGVNGYLIANNSSNISILRMEIKENLIINIVDKMAKVVLLNTFKKQIIDIKTAFYSIVVALPLHLFSILNGQVGGVYEYVLNERKLLLEKYYKFMNKVNPEYGVYDVYRWHTYKNIKWDTIYRLNQFFSMK